MFLQQIQMVGHVYFNNRMNVFYLTIPQGGDSHFFIT